MNLLREYIRALLEFSIKANRKNVHQDGTSKSRGYMSGIDKTWTGEDTNDHLHNWYKEMGLMSESRSGTVHPKIYDMIARANENGYKVEVTNHSVAIYDDAENIVAQVDWEQDPMYGPCLDASIVTNARATTGFGPLAYDVAIEVTGGLTPDRTTVSDEARDVWDYYNTVRHDVKKEQLDDLENKLTPAEQDNCEQNSASEDSAIGSPGNWDESVLSKKYSKQGSPVYDELRSRDMLV